MPTAGRETPQAFPCRFVRKVKGLEITQKKPELWLSRGPGFAQYSVALGKIDSLVIFLPPDKQLYLHRGGRNRQQKAGLDPGLIVSIRVTRQEIP